MALGQRIQTTIAEIIGSPRRVITWLGSSLWGVVGNALGTRDVGRADYAYWDRARHARVEGLQISGLLLKPIASKIAAWTMGRAPAMRMDNAALADALSLWFHSIHSDVLRAWEEALNLGDAYIVINGDMSVTVLPPHVVTPIVDPADYSEVIGWRVVEVFPDPMQPAQKMRIIDEYYADRRTRVKLLNGTEIAREEWPNPLGVVPVVHWPNLRSLDEMFGRPEGEALVYALQRYGEVLDAALDGNRKQGRSLLAIEGFDSQADLDKFWEMYGKTETIEHPDGTSETAVYIDLTSDDVITLSGNATASFKAPDAKAEDTMTLLEVLYYLFIEHTELPEFIMGTAVASSKASTETQMPPFELFITKKQGMIEKPLMQLLDIGRRMLGVVDAGLRTGADEIRLSWPTLSGEDGKLTLDTLKWAYGVGLIDDETALQLAPVAIEDVRAVLDNARAQVEAQRSDEEAFADRIDRELRFGPGARVADPEVDVSRNPEVA
jgi:hypothetical protein